MPLVKNVEKRIWDCEGFDVKIKDSQGRDIRSDMTGLPMYPCTRAAKNDSTITSWKRIRFNKYYPGLRVDVLDGRGVAVTGNTRLGTVRDTYAED
jgi:hypothetical protein